MGKPQFAHPSLHHPPPLQKKSGKLMFRYSDDCLQEMLNISLCYSSWRAAPGEQGPDPVSSAVLPKGQDTGARQPRMCQASAALPTGNLAQGAKP